MIIGVDIDNVIADTEKELRRLIREKKGLSLSREDITSYNLDGVRGLSQVDLAGIYDEFKDGGIFLGLEVIEGARETLERLSLRHRVVLVTSRPRTVEDKTRSWLARERIPFHELHFATESKVNGIPYELFLEDQDNFARELADDGTYVLLFDAPWNRHVEHENISRVYSWSDVQKFCFPPCALS